MCEFCNDPSTFNTNNRDAAHHDFAGFFSADAITAAVAQANASSTSRGNNTNATTTDDDESDAEGEDSDGT